MSTAPRDAMSYLDPDTGFTMMPGTQRPDGSWRKPRRVKEGYTPQDEVPLYESKGKAIAKARDTSYIPGMSHSPTPGYSNITNFKIDTFVIPIPVVIIPGLNTDPTPAHTNTSAKSKKKKKGSNQTQSSSNGVPELANRMSQSSISDKPRNPSGQPVATDPAKKLRNLRKKLRDIEALEARLDSGEIENPEPEQVDKIARKQDVIKEISALEKITDSQG
eukprot:TRINITY_DN4798_c0_g1_i1.p1 TRINITY_DN4798_c0_g1~~TRINITY_DN4798_c0_g1_i1.p1  ORF type:complete len:219 (-),score=61.78 TRINITY_DN4798_c0_g1_i1:277-933(-)